MRGRHHSRHRVADDVKIEMPITPMLDMSFQLLSFFILTFNPPGAGEGQLDMFLPASGAAKAKAPADVDPLQQSDKELEPPADVTVIVESSRGGIDRLTVAEKEKRTPITDASLTELKTVLSKLRTEVGQANIKVEADGALKYVFLIEVMDVCLKCDFTSVGFAPLPDMKNRR